MPPMTIQMTDPVLWSAKNLRSVKNMTAGLVVAIALSWPVCGRAEQSAPAPEAPASAGENAPAPAPPKPEASEKPLRALERWLEKSASDLKAGIDASQEKWRKLNEENEQAAKDAAREAAKNAAEALKTFSGMKIVEGRELCPTAPNGSPDCQPAAEKICQAKGFASGKSADIQTTRKCSPRALLSGAPAREACVSETFVIKAACQ